MEKARWKFSPSISCASSRGDLAFQANCSKSHFFPEFSHVDGVESRLQEEDFHAEKLLSSSSAGVYKSSALPSP